MLNNKDNDYILLNILIFETYMYEEGGTVKYIRVCLLLIKLEIFIYCGNNNIFPTHLHRWYN